MATRVQKRTTVAAGRRVAKSTPKEQRHVAQAMICGALFVLLVGLKVLLPQATGQLQDTISNMLGHNIDVEAVFSAVSTFGQEEDMVESLQEAVFGEETIVEIVPVQEETMIETTVEPTVETAVDDIEWAQILYSQENLPDNVSLEQTVLGFAFQSPIVGMLSSSFGYRTDPTEGTNQFHYGVDLVGTLGDTIVAFADGTVRAVGESSSYGKYLIIDHADGYATLYAHCDSISVSTDATVIMGQTIATVGQTGDATGPHLHFELMLGNLYLNPIYYVETA